MIKPEKPFSAQLATRLGQSDADAVERERGPYASALARGDWQKAAELEAAGWDPKYVETESERSDDFLATLNKPPAPHWLLIHAPDRFLEWFERAKTVIGETALMALIKVKSSDQPMQFFAYTPLALTMKLAAHKEHEAGGEAGEIDYAREEAISQALMAMGADPSEGDRKDRSCFCFMPKGRQGAKLFGEMMLARGGNPQTGVERGNSFLEAACETGSSEWVKLALTEWGLSPSCGDERPSALYWACASVAGLGLDDEAFGALMEACDPSELDGGGASALHRLAIAYAYEGQSQLEESGRLVALKRALILMDAGLDPHAPDLDGESAWSLAMEGPDQRLALMLGSLKTQQALESVTGPGAAGGKRKAPGL